MMAPAAAACGDDDYEASVRLAEQLAAADAAHAAGEEASLALALRLAAGGGAGGDASDEEDVGFAREVPPQKRARTGPPLDDELELPRDGLGIRLMRAAGAPAAHNAGSWVISDLLPAADGASGALRWVLWSNVHARRDWMFSECPRLLDAPRLFLLCDGGNAEVLREEYAHVANVRLFFPPLPFEWGCHHAKFTVAVFARACVVSIHTANCGTSRRGSDVTQGLWTQAFPRKQDDAPGLSDFEDQLVAYLTCTHWLGGTLPCGETVTAASLRAFDFSGARAALVASVPGRHINGALRAYGHMRVRALLEAERFDASLIGSDIVLQFAAVAKVTPQWLQEVFDSFGAGAADDAAATLLGAPPLTEAPGQPRAHIVWPTMREIQCSAGGWGTGGVLPATAAYLAVEALRCRLARWSGAPGAPGAEGRARYPPHMKSFWRMDTATGALAYALLASHNGSRAAWGALEKDGSQLFIKSYELGVLLLPRLAGVRRLVTTAAARAGRSADGATLALRAPFPLPPVRYAAGEAPWCMDAAPLGEPDAHGVFVCNAMGHDGKPTRALAQGRPARAAAGDDDGPIVLD